MQATTKKLEEMTLLAVDSNAKTVKGQAMGYFTAISYLAPYNLANGKTILCAHATKGCVKACLNESGMGKFPNVQKARIEKALKFIENPKTYMAKVHKELEKLFKKYGTALVVRLNGTTDIPFEGIKYSYNEIEYINIFNAFPNITFYDYTKNPRRVLNNDIKNYYLTFSRAETKLNIEASKVILSEGKNVAIVFSEKLYNEIILKGEILYNGKLVNILDGDQNDLRFLDKQNSIIALKAKGSKGKKDDTGFVVRSLDEL
jgi:hypothetical protein